MSDQENQDLVRKEAVISATRTRLRRGRTLEEGGSEERIAIRSFATATASISYKFGATINTGNYESSRVDVMITVPCYVEEIHEVAEETRAIAQKLFDVETEKAKTGVPY